MRNWDDLPLVLTAEEVAELLRVHYNTVKAMARDGRLRAVKVGREWRFSRDDVLALVRGEQKQE